MNQLASLNSELVIHLQVTRGATFEICSLTLQTEKEKKFIAQNDWANPKRILRGLYLGPLGAVSLPLGSILSSQATFDCNVLTQGFFKFEYVATYLKTTQREPNVLVSIVSVVFINKPCRAII